MKDRSEEIIHMHDKDKTVISPDYKTVALIPARSGSKRIPNKNIRDFQGLPLLAWTIRAALRSHQFHDIYVSSDCMTTLKIAEQHGAKGILRPVEYAADLSPDIEWVKHALVEIFEADIFAILRPTAPFRTALTICRAMGRFINSQPCDSIRAVELCKQHPYKMWRVIDEKNMEPLFSGERHSMPYQSLQKIYVQNASLEIAWEETVYKTGTIAGNVIKPFFTEGYEGFDLNSEDDWFLAEALIKAGKVSMEGR